MFLPFLWTDREVGYYDAAYNFIHGLRRDPGRHLDGRVPRPSPGWRPRTARPPRARRALFLRTGL